MTEVDLRTAVLDGEGRVAIRAVLDLPADVEAVVELDAHAAQLEQTAPNVVQGELHVPKAALWWPHTHGEPTLFPLTLRLNGTTCDLGSVGFRTIDTQHDDDGRASRSQSTACRYSAVAPAGPAPISLRYRAMRQHTAPGSRQCATPA